MKRRYSGPVISGLSTIIQLSLDNASLSTGPTPTQNFNSRRPFTDAHTQRQSFQCYNPNAQSFSAIKRSPWKRATIEHQIFNRSPNFEGLTLDICFYISTPRERESHYIYIYFFSTLCHGFAVVKVEGEKKTAQDDNIRCSDTFSQGLETKCRENISTDEGAWKRKHNTFHPLFLSLFRCGIPFNEFPRVLSKLYTSTTYRGDATGSAKMR